jgi:hypothetical protein
MFGNLNVRQRETVAKEVSELSVQFTAHLQSQGLSFFEARQATAKLIKEVLGNGNSPDSWAGNLVTSDRTAKEQSQLWKQYEQFRGTLRRQTEPTNITIDKDSLMVPEVQDLMSNPEKWKNSLFLDEKPKKAKRFPERGDEDYPQWISLCKRRGLDPNTGRAWPEDDDE